MHSNKYTLIFTSIITISLGFVLSYAATSLKPRQDINVEIDMKKNILTALGIKPQKSEKNGLLKRSKRSMKKVSMELF